MHFLYFVVPLLVKVSSAGRTTYWYYGDHSGTSPDRDHISVDYGHHSRTSPDRDHISVDYGHHSGTSPERTIYW